MPPHDVIFSITKKYIVTLINIIGKCSILLLFIRVSSENSLEQYIKESTWSSWALCCLHENLGNKREVNYFFLWGGQIFSLGTQGLYALRIYCGSYLIPIGRLEIFYMTVSFLMYIDVSAGIRDNGVSMMLGCISW